MSGHPFISIPANTVLTVSAGGIGTGSIGLTVVDGDLCIAITEDGGSRVMVARLDELGIDDFCGMLADHLPATAGDGVNALSERGPCTSRH